MSYCRVEGKDKLMFVTPEDHLTTSKVTLKEKEVDDDAASGAVLPNGDIDFGCPCLGDLPLGPCGPSFREFFTCFVRSTAELKASDCHDLGNAWIKCVDKFPEIYNNNRETGSNVENSSEEKSDGQQHVDNIEKVSQNNE